MRSQGEISGVISRMISDCRPQQAAAARARRAGQKAVDGARGKCDRGSNGSHGHARGPWPTRRTFPCLNPSRWVDPYLGRSSGDTGVREAPVTANKLASRINARVECGRRGGRRWPRRAAATRWVGEQANRRLQSMGKRTGLVLGRACAAVVASWRARTSDVSRAHAPTMAP